MKETPFRLLPMFQAWRNRREVGKGWQGCGRSGWLLWMLTLQFKTSRQQNKSGAVHLKMIRGTIIYVNPVPLEPAFSPAFLFHNSRTHPSLFRNFRIKMLLASAARWIEWDSGEDCAKVLSLLIQILPLSIIIGDLNLHNMLPKRSYFSSKVPRISYSGHRQLPQDMERGIRYEWEGRVF